MMETTPLALTDLEMEMVAICARVLDVEIIQVDVGYTDGTTQVVALSGDTMRVPNRNRRKTLDWVAVPLEQGVSQRQLGYAARAHRTNNTLEVGVTVMLGMMEQTE